jgi:hypothetical protein
MRAFWSAVTCCLCLTVLWACMRSPTPPVGRWEGTYEASDVMVAVRLEITPKGEIYLCAPDLMDIANSSGDERPAMRQKLAQDLVIEWGAVEPRSLEFDGRVFRKPGGVAPQMEWNPQSRSMTAVLYLGMHAAIRVPMHTVTEFSTDPWSG